MREVKTLGLLGAGVIGAGWAARALHFGIDVIVADVNPEMEAWLQESVANAEPALARLTRAPLPPKGTLSFTTDLAEMARHSDFIQENVPEQPALKRRLLAELSQHAGADVIIASSTSGIMPTELQQEMIGPERLCVGHPFNPVYLAPLVEVVGGEHTSQDTIAGAQAFYTYIGMHALHVRNEVPGHLSDRLQEALWREILHMVNEGVATTDELDQSIVYGPGLRWAAMGTNMIFHIAGGERGMRYMLEHFGPALEWPWTKLVAPKLTDELIDSMVAGSHEQADGRSVRDLERLRDSCMVAIQQILREHDIASGGTLRALEDRLYREAVERAVTEPGTLEFSFPCDVRPEWTTANGHIAASCWSFVIDDALAAFCSRMMLDNWLLTETYTRQIAAPRASDPLMTRVQVAAVTPTQAHLMIDSELGGVSQLSAEVVITGPESGWSESALKALQDRLKSGIERLKLKIA
jgi:carnitine 3-dehydrogenase